MRQFCTRAVMSLALLALATGASAQSVKLDVFTTFSPDDALNGLPEEAAQGPDGAFYAVSTFSDSPTVSFFRINPVTRTHTVWATLDTGQTNPGASRLVLASDRRFYASFLSDQGGGILAFDPIARTASVVREFLMDETGAPGADGVMPGPLTLGRDGRLYAAMSQSSPDVDPFQSGSLFRFDPTSDPSEAFETLHQFQFAAADGAYPFEPLVEGADGVWYGTNLDVVTGCSNAFKFETNTLTVLHTFDAVTEGCGVGALAVLPSGLLVGVAFNDFPDLLDPESATGRVFTLDPESKAVVPVHTFLAADLFTPILPGNLTVAPDGSVFVMAQNFDAGIASILRLRLDSGAEHIADMIGFPEIGALTMGRDGRVYGIFASTDVFALGVLDPLSVLAAGGNSGGTTTLSATLNALGVPLAGRRIAFTVNGDPVGSAVTDIAGVATLDNVSLAGVPAGTFPNGVGASFDGGALFSATAGTGLLNVLAAATPGMMIGDGFIAEGQVRYDFKFVVKEKADGTDRGKLDLRIKDVEDGRRKKQIRRNDRFVSTSYTDVVFDLDPAAGPQFDIVTFKGTGTWNGVAGYRFEAVAQDHVGRGRCRETFEIKIYNSANQEVASVEGIVKGGSLKSRRIHRH